MRRRSHRLRRGMRIAVIGAFTRWASRRCDAPGATNRDAAAALFVSVRTVETHVASSYRKLGVRTRAELARRRAGSQ